MPQTALNCNFTIIDKDQRSAILCFETVLQYAQQLCKLI